MMGNVELLPASYKAICAICGRETVAADYPDGTRPFQTFSIGLEKGSAFAFGVVQFCPEHIAAADALGVLRAWFVGSMTQITAALGQWDLPDGSMTPVFILGHIVHPDGRREARIVTVDEEAVKHPLHVPIEQVATWLPTKQ